MKSSTRQRKAALRVHLESIVAAGRAIDDEMRAVPHSRSLTRESLSYKKESITHECDGSFKAKYRARDGEYYTITVQREPHQKELPFTEGGCGASSNKIA